MLAGSFTRSMYRQLREAVEEPAQNSYLFSLLSFFPWHLYGASFDDFRYQYIYWRFVFGIQLSST